MKNQWTFTEENNIEWVQETFHSKIDARAEGKKVIERRYLDVDKLTRNYREMDYKKTLRRNRLYFHIM